MTYIKGTGSGDMLKSIYDNDEDGVIALAQTEAQCTYSNSSISANLDLSSILTQGIVLSPSSNTFYNATTISDGSGDVYATVRRIKLPAYKPSLVNLNVELRSGAGANDGDYQARIVNSNTSVIGAEVSHTLTYPNWTDYSFSNVTIPTDYLIILQTKKSSAAYSTHNIRNFKILANASVEGPTDSA
jgi:hypothetical protein